MIRIIKDIEPHTDEVVITKTTNTLHINNDPDSSDNSSSDSEEEIETPQTRVETPITSPPASHTRSAPKTPKHDKNTRLTRS